MLKLGRARSSYGSWTSRDIPITEYEPKKIKMAITGNEMPVRTSCQNATATFGIERLPKNLDSTDGLAAAVCHF
jgi:crossover junction endodeoxyribonuclease RuvC